LIEETRRLYEGTGADRLTVSSDLRKVVDRLMANQGEIPLELPWEEVQEGARVSRHQVVLTRLDGEAGRVYFYNPAAADDDEPGTELGGPMAGPPRRTEGPRVESMAFEDFARYFAEGHAYALLRQQE
jgi:hypothetical protein